MELVYILHVVICVFLVCTILFQDGKTGGLTGVADNASQAVFGAKGASDFLTKLTTALAIMFMATSLSLAIFNSPDTKSIAADYQPPTTEDSSTAVPDNTLPATGGGVQQINEDGTVTPRNLADSVDQIDVITNPDEVPKEILEGHQKDLERQKAEQEEAQGKAQEQQKKDDQ